MYIYNISLFIFHVIISFVPSTGGRRVRRRANVPGRSPVIPRESRPSDRCGRRRDVRVFKRLSRFACFSLPDAAKKSASTSSV